MRLKKKGKFYHAFYRTASGKEASTSTKCTDLNKAKEAAKSSGIAELESVARNVRLTGTVITQITSDRKLTLEKAVAGFAKAMKAKSRSPKTIHNSLGVVWAWIRDMNLDGLSPAAITTDHVNGWINSKTSDISASTRKVNLATIRSFFGFMCDRGWLAGNPSGLASVNMNALSHEQKEVAVRQPFSAAEIKRLLGFIKGARAEAESDLAKLSTKSKHTFKSWRSIKLQERIEAMRFWDFAVRLSRETGLRLSDVCGLEWNSFNKPGVITVHTQKTGSRVELPGSGGLFDLVSCIPVEHKDYVFPREREINRSPERRSLLSVQFTRLCKAAGVKGKSFHCLRHTSATDQYSKVDKDALARKLAEVMTVSQIAQLLGHSNHKTTKGYVHE